jgi:hypothetical protein
MHACDLVELAALLSTAGLERIAQGQRLSGAALQQYWRASKCRLDRWSGRLKSLRERLADHSALAANSLESAWRAALPICREVLASEMLTRLWAAWSVAYDGRHQTDEAEPIARSVWLGHLDARRRTLEFLAAAPSVRRREALALDRLRRASQRWTDLLLASFAAHGDVSHLAHDASRLADFAEELSDSPFHAPTGLASRVRVSSLRATFAVRDGYATGNADLNSEIAGAILTYFESDWSSAPLVPASFWLARLSAVFQETQTSVDQLLSGKGLRLEA